MPPERAYHHGNLREALVRAALDMIAERGIAGTGIGLANIRERLKLLYGDKASMVVADNRPSGTIVTLTVPYQAQMRTGATA